MGNFYSDKVFIEFMYIGAIYKVCRNVLLTI